MRSSVLLPLPPCGAALPAFARTTVIKRSTAPPCCIAHCDVALWRCSQVARLWRAWCRTNSATCPYARMCAAPPRTERRPPRQRQCQLVATIPARAADAAAACGALPPRRGRSSLV